MIDVLGQDLGYAVRTFRRSPGFAALAILTIAIGVGANAAVFSIVNSVLLRPPPFADPDRLVLASQTNRQTKVSAGDASPANFLDSMTFALRAAAPPAMLTAAIREAIWRVDKDQPVGTVLTMDQRLSNSLSRRRFSVTLLLAFGAVAVTLTAIGLYGVLAFVVAQRRLEIGVRMALGARPGRVVADVMGHGLRLAGLGVVVGLVLALAATRLLRTLLYGTSPTDVATFASVATLLILIAAGASALPAVRASRVDPLVALREE